jgi:hypothetical protein
MNFLTYLFDWSGSAPNALVPNALGTEVDLNGFLADAADAPQLVDRLANLALGAPLSPELRTSTIDAVQWWTASTDSATWKLNRVRTAAHLIFGSPNYQIQR